MIGWNATSLFIDLGEKLLMWSCGAMPPVPGAAVDMAITMATDTMAVWLTNTKSVDCS